MIAAAGAAGTLARYFTGAAAQSLFGGGFPYGTLIVNMAGSFLFGLVYAVGGARTSLSPEIKTIILTGFMGAFTTFSTFAFDTQNLARVSGVVAAGANVAIQIAGGVALMLLGLALGAKI